MTGPSVYLGLQGPLCGTHLHQIGVYDLMTESTALTRVGGKGKGPHHSLVPVAAHIPFVHAASSEEVNGMEVFLLPGARPASRLWNGVHCCHHQHALSPRELPESPVYSQKPHHVHPNRRQGMMVSHQEGSASRVWFATVTPSSQESETGGLLSPALGG